MIRTPFEILNFKNQQYGILCNAPPLWCTSQLGVKKQS